MLAARASRIPDGAYDAGVLPPGRGREPQPVRPPFRPGWARAGARRCRARRGDAGVAGHREAAATDRWVLASAVVHIRGEHAIDWRRN